MNKEEIYKLRTVSANQSNNEESHEVWYKGLLEIAKQNGTFYRSFRSKSSINNSSLTTEYQTPMKITLEQNDQNIKGNYYYYYYYYYYY